MKKCSKCKNEFPPTKEYFVIDKRSKNGLGCYCRKCKNGINKKAWPKKYTPEYKAKRKIWIKNNHDELKIKRRKIYKNRIEKDQEYVLTNRLRSRLKNAFIRFSKNGKIKNAKEYGIDYKAIFNHIGPCPGLRNEWHIDHIIPLSSFNFDDPEQVKKAFAPENHQWLSKIDNLIKGSKLPSK
jgi:hypothetical protein